MPLKFSFSLRLLALSMYYIYFQLIMFFEVKWHVEAMFC